MNVDSLRHAITSLISVISSTLRGVEYLTHGKNMCIIDKIIEVSFLGLKLLDSQKTGER
jgi:hypothetical protein